LATADADPAVGQLASPQAAEHPAVILEFTAIMSVIHNVTSLVILVTRWSVGRSPARDVAGR